MAVEHLERQVHSFEDGRVFGSAGAFEELVGTVRFAVNPMAHENRGITDLDLVPPDSDGLVRFSATWRAVRPVDWALGNRRLFLDLANRGGLRLWRNTNRQGPPPLLSGADAVADGWILGQGYTVVSCGWQHDVPQRDGMLRADLPAAQVNGQPVSGLVLCHIEPMHDTATMPLGHVGHRPYPPVNMQDPDATLSMRRAADGAWTRIARERWRFGSPDETGMDGATVTLDEGFEAGCSYELAYTGTGAVPTALGLVGVREFLAFLRYSDAPTNPFASGIDHTYAFGGSQPGNVLRFMESAGLFRDGAGRPVIDGAIVHGAGIGKSEANWRFGQPSVFAPRSVAYTGPFSEAAQREPDGEEAAALLREPAATAAKMIYSLTACDYRDLFGALSHTELDGSEDLVMPENVRIYYMAGGPHLRSAFDDDSLSAIANQAVASLDLSTFLRAAVVNLDRWVSEGIPAPASRYPTLSAGTLVPAAAAIARIEAATGERAPPSLSLGRLDFGPRMHHFIVDQPPVTRAPYAMLACEVDADGNDVDGLRHPEVAVPLATYLPWNYARTSSPANPHGLTLIGSCSPFAPSVPAQGDSRLPITARYASRTEYLAEVRAAASALIADGFVLASDEDGIVEAAARRYDRLTEDVEVPTETGTVAATSA